MLQVPMTLAAPFMAGLDTLERIIAVINDAGNARILVFSLMIGGLLGYIR